MYDYICNMFYNFGLFTGMGDDDEMVMGYEKSEIDKIERYDGCGNSVGKNMTD